MKLYSLNKFNQHYNQLINSNKLQKMMSRSSTIDRTLSIAYKKVKQPIKNETKLDLFGKDIKIIDELHFVPSSILSQITQIDLSHNNITQLNNLTQFKRVQRINLSHNQIEDASQLVRLEQITTLQCIFLKGNPLTKQDILNNPKVLRLFCLLIHDLNIFPSEITALIDSLQEKIIQAWSYDQYLNKILIHIQLANLNDNQTQQIPFFLKQAKNSKISSMFPKIKKIFEQHFYQQMLFGSKRYLCKHYLTEDKLKFNQVKIFQSYLMEISEKLDLSRGQIIRKIYQKQEELKNIRSKKRDHHVIDHPSLKKTFRDNQKIQMMQSSTMRLKQSFKNRNLQHSWKREVKPLQSSKISSSNIMQNTATKRNENSPRKTMLLAKDDENFQQLYQTLIYKLNPVYHLLHSPLHSLKSNEKDLLISSLSFHLKQKWKQLWKMDKVAEQYQLLQEDFHNLQDICKVNAEDMNIQMENLQEELYQVTALFNQKCQSLDEITCEKQKKDIFLENITNQNKDLMNKVINKQKIIRQYQNQEDLVEKIIASKEKRIKLKYLMIVQKQSFNRFNFYKDQQIWRSIENSKLIATTFLDLKNIILLEKNQKYLKKCLIKKKFKELNQLMNKEVDLKKNQKYLSQKKNNKNQKIFLQILKLRFISEKESKNLIQTQKNGRNKKIKQKIFNVLKKFLDEKYELRDRDEGNLLRNDLLLKKYFGGWLLSRKIHQHYEAQCSILINDKRKTLFLTHLENYFLREKDHFARFIGLDLFLIKYRKIFYYHLFSKSINQTLLSRKMKINKIIKNQLNNYLGFFIKTMRAKRVQKFIQKSEQQRYERQQRKILQQIAKQKKKNSSKSGNTFKIMLKQLFFKKVKQIIFMDKQSLRLNKNLLNNKTKQIISFLRSSTHKNLKLKLKELLLKELLKHSHQNNPFNYFFESLKKLIAKEKTTGQLQKIKIKYALMKTFSTWKIFNLTEKTKFLKFKLDELGPQIQEISIRQRQTNSDKILLMQDLEDKETKIKFYEKKFYEYDYLLRSKQLKYQKLKDIYSEVIQDKEMLIEEGTNCINFRDRIPERDYQMSTTYLKRNPIKEYTAGKFAGKYDDQFQYTKMIDPQQEVKQLRNNLNQNNHFDWTSFKKF